MNKTQQLYQLIWTSRPLMQAAEAAVESGLAGTGLTVRSRAVLEILYSDGAATVPEIAQRLEIKRQYVQLMVDEVVGEWLAERQPNPRHKKSALIALTDSGRATIAAVIRREQAIVETIARQFHADDVDTALRVILELAETLKATTAKETG